MPKKPKLIKVEVDASSGIPTEIELSADQWSLVNAYFDENMNQTRAYLSLHPESGYDSARTTASVIFAKPNIRAEITRRLRDKSMSSDEVLYRLGDMARAYLMPFIRVDSDGFVYFDFSDSDAKRHMHLIKKIKTKRERRLEGRGDEAETWEGEWVEVELHDPLKALELIGKQYKMFTDKDERKIDAQSTVYSIPASMIAPSFFDVNRDIENRGHTEYILSGGRGSTKSSFVSLSIIILIKNNPTMHALVMRQVADTLRGSVYAQLQWAISELGYSDEFKSTTSPMEITYLPTGQTIYFRGADDPGKIKSIKTAFGYIGLLWFEETSEFRGDNAVRNVTQSAIRGGDAGFIFKSFNPPRTASNWINKYLLTPKDAQYQHRSDYRNVPVEWLGATFIAEAEHLKNVNDLAYRHEYLGEVVGSGGLVFNNLEIRNITDAEMSQFDRIYQGLDWGYSIDPLHWVKVHYDAARETIYVFDEFRAHKMSNRELYEYLIEAKGVTPEDEIIADSAEPKSVQDLKSYGLNCRGAEKGPESVRYSMRWLENRAKIVIDNKRCPSIAEEMINYSFEQTKDGEFVSGYPDRDNHGIDSLRYSLNRVWRRRGE